MADGFSLGGKRINASIMFTDIRSFTSLSERSDPADTIEMLNSYFASTFEPISLHGGIVNQIIGDGLMAIFGAPLPRPDHRQHAVGLQGRHRVDHLIAEPVGGADHLGDDDHDQRDREGHAESGEDEGRSGGNHGYRPWHGRRESHCGRRGVLWRLKHGRSHRRRVRYHGHRG